jgi:hypothetical protein
VAVAARELLSLLELAELVAVAQEETLLMVLLELRTLAAVAVAVTLPIMVAQAVLELLF